MKTQTTRLKWLRCNRANCLAILSLWIFALSCPTVNAQSEHLSQDIEVSNARRLFHNERYYDALKILRPLAIPARLDITDIRFLIGLSAIFIAETKPPSAERTALLDEAISALYAILVNAPQLTRVRLELARAFFLKGSDDLSKNQFERVLASDLDPTIANNIRRFLHTIRARRRWSGGYFLVSLEKNNNINSGPPNRLISGNRLLTDASLPQETFGFSVSTGNEYQYPINESWRWRFGADLYGNEYEDDSFEQNYLAIRSGPRWLISRRSEASLQGFAGQRYIAGALFNRESGFRFEAKHQATSRVSLNTRSNWQQNQFHQDRVDATEIEYGLGVEYLFSPLLQGSINLNLARSDPKIGILSIRGRTVNIGLHKVFTKGWSIGGSLEWVRRRHNNFPATRPSLTRPSPSDREDRGRNSRLFLLNRNFTFSGFSPQLIVTREQRASNYEVANYKRTTTSFRFIRQF